MSTSTRWSAGIVGWVVESRDSRHTKNGTPHVSWWYGPDHGFGTTWGPLDGSTRVWARYDDAERDVLRTLGSASIGRSGKRETVIRRVEHAERDLLSRLDAYHARTDDALDSTHERAEQLRRSLASR